MAKVPVAGAVKTRLQPFLTAKESAGLAACFLQDAVRKALQTRQEMVIAFSPANKTRDLEAHLEANYTLIVQEGDNLGERMQNAFEKVFAMGFEQVSMVGTDSPTFPVTCFSDAVRFLSDGADVVLGETEDGGFYFIGLRKPRPEIFANVDWSTEKTFKQTARNAALAGLRLELLDKWYDVDLPEDLKRLAEELDQNPEIAPATAEWLKNF